VFTVKRITKYANRRLLFLESKTHIRAYHNISYKDFFYYVDFGEKANNFLKLCGVKYSPTPEELARMLVRSSIKIWKTMGDKYMDILRVVAINIRTIRQNKELVSEMKRARMFVGVGIEPSDDGEEHVTRHVLARAQEIFLNDDHHLWRMFGVFTCPEDRLLENLYQVRIMDLIKEDN